MPARSSYEYALVRVVPRVERMEFINAGAIVHCRDHRSLEAGIALDESRLLALYPDLTGDALAEIERHLEALSEIARGGDRAGPIGRLPQTDRFHWLVAPRSTVVQTSPVHVGLCEQPAQAMERLLDRFVRTGIPIGEKQNK